MNRIVKNSFFSIISISIFSFLILNITALATEKHREGEIYDISHGDKSGSIGKMNYQGYTYKVMMVGSRWWMTEGLRATKYNDGTPIQNARDNSNWSGTDNGAWCDYNNDPVTGDIYGKLYNYYAVSTGKLAPPGWRVTKLGDWKKIKDQNFYKTLTGGCRFFNGNFHLAGKSGYFWASFKNFIGRVGMHYSRFDHMGTELYIYPINDERFGYSVLCVKE